MKQLYTLLLLALVAGATAQTLTPPVKIFTIPNWYAYGANSIIKELTALPDLNAVAYTNRQAPTAYGGVGTSGHLRYTISTNQGDTWTNPNLVGGLLNDSSGTMSPGRYVAARLFTQGGNQLPNLKLHATASTLDPSGSGWNGVVYCTEQNAASISAVSSQEQYAYQGGTGIFSVQGMITERIPGEFWHIRPNLDDEFVYVFKGTYNAANGYLEWVCNDTIQPNWNTSIDGDAHWRLCNIAFSPDGTKGYVCMLGDLTGGRDSIYAPVLSAYDAVTGKFDTPYEVDINEPSLLTPMLQWYQNLGGTNPASMKLTNMSNADFTVDIDGNPHIFTGLAFGFSSTPYAVWSVGIKLMDIFSSNGNWNFMEIDSIYQHLNQQHFQIARTKDGKYLAYTWADSTGTSSNPVVGSDLWGRMFDVNANQISPAINWTQNDPLWHNTVSLPKTSEFIFANANASPCGFIFEVPTTSAHNQLITNTLDTLSIYYFPNISYDCSTLNTTPQTLSVKSAYNPLRHFSLSPNPAREWLSVRASWGKSEEVQLNILNLQGQRLHHKTYANSAELSEQLPLHDLPSGIYLLQLSSTDWQRSAKFVRE